MIIKKIKLENIRSYIEREINFELGSTLLSGDIGSGKSSILQAIDFALFGLSKGVLSGESLLRYGKNKGSVELEFKIGNFDIKVKRSLKRSSDSVVQNSGYLEINGAREELSAVELKQRILDLLNYPKETLTKKSLIYRYTVYTPQEEMKSILLSDDKYRIDTLRKIFNIDKYKRIKDNSKIVSYHLRERIKERETLILDLEELKKEKTEKEGELDSLNNKLNEINSKFSVASMRVEDRKNEIGLIEEKIKLFNELRKNFELRELELKNLTSRILNNEEFGARLEGDIARLQEEIGTGVEVKSYDTDIIAVRGKINKCEIELRTITQRMSESKVGYMSSERMINELKSLKKCPVCKQDVNDDHRHAIVGAEEINMTYLRDSIKELTLQENKLMIEIRDFRSRLESISMEKSRFEIWRLKRKNLIDKKDNLENVKREINNDGARVRGLESEISELRSRIGEINTNDYARLKRDLDGLLVEEREILLNKTSVETRIKNILEILAKLREGVERREKYREELFSLKNLRSFIDSDFVGLVEDIEKKIMLKVHGDFNSLFEKWFNILVDDDNLIVALDEDFSPLVEQNGYNLDYLNLSGGEKTAGALAYRLALNQVINNVVSDIQTKNLIILDEPTDGFSESQLDRMRILLQEIDIKQVIIVSHDPKIESYVDRVLRLDKKEGVTEVL
ncbi:SMC family ATPase [Candidatus Woesearchaeota archaeon]|nr:SMC family ATPase [Candidatus Woesearchaeota archaeon]